MAKKEKSEETLKSLVQKRVEPTLSGTTSELSTPSVGETITMPVANTETTARLSAAPESEPEALYTVSQEANGRVTFIVHPAASSEGKGHYALKAYIDTYKNLSGEPISSVIIQMPDGLFKENLAPITEPLKHTSPSLYTFTITEHDNKQVVLSMDIPTMDANTIQTRLGLNKCKLYAIGLSEDLNTEVEVSIKGKDIHIPKIEEEYNKEKLKIRLKNNQRVIILGLATTLAVCIGITLIILAVSRPYILGPVLGSAFAIAGPILLIGPLYIPVFFPEALRPYISKNNEHQVTALYDKHFCEKLKSQIFND